MGEILFPPGKHRRQDSLIQSMSILGDEGATPEFVIGPLTPARMTSRHQLLEGRGARKPFWNSRQQWQHGLEALVHLTKHRTDASKLSLPTPWGVATLQSLIRELPYLAFFHKSYFLRIWYSLFHRNRRNLRPSSADQPQAPMAESLRLPPASKDGSHVQRSQ
jgi:hypothetical protein